MWRKWIYRVWSIYKVNSVNLTVDIRWHLVLIKACSVKTECYIVCVMHSAKGATYCGTCHIVQVNLRKKTPYCKGCHNVVHAQFPHCAKGACHIILGA